MAKKYKVTEHEMVPKHEVLSSEEKEELLDEMEIKAEQLPKIKKNDAVVKELDTSVGDVLRIVRNSPTAGKSTYYRLVIKE